jgi:hypothetical protein
LVTRAFDLQPPAEGLESCPTGTRCALTGEPLAAGHSIATIVSDAQGEWWETFNGDPFGWLSPTAAACWRASNPKRDMRMSKSFAVFGGAAYEPMISQASADAQGRPSWRDLVRRAWAEHRGEPCAVVLSSDTKKRVWMRGRAGVLGHQTPVLIYDTGDIGLYETRVIDWPLMLDDLALVEGVFDAGFYRRDVATTLLGNPAAADVMGWGETAAVETALRQARPRPWWPFVLLIARPLDKNGETRR